MSRADQDAQVQKQAREQIEYCERRAHPMFRDHSCWKCREGTTVCPQGGPHRCEFPHARND